MVVDKNGLSCGDWIVSEITDDGESTGKPGNDTHDSGKVGLSVSNVSVHSKE